MFTQIVVGYIPTPKVSPPSTPPSSSPRGRGAPHRGQHRPRRQLRRPDVRLCRGDRHHRPPAGQRRHLPRGAPADVGARAADEILGTAEEVDADLVVIGVRRRSPVGKLVTGSTAQQVLLGAPCSVLAVKAP